MVINETLIKSIFSRQNIIKHFLINILLILVICVISIIIIINSHIVIYKQYQSTINNTNINYNYDITESSNKYKDVMSKCLAINCERIVLKTNLDMIDDNYKYDIYKIEHDLDTNYNYLKLVEGEKFQTFLFTKYLTSELRMIIYGKHAIYIMNDNSYLESTLNVTFYIIVLFAIIITILNFYVIYHSFKNDIYEKKNYITYIENKLQGNVTEMIHHEINAPLSILMSTSYLIKEIIERKSELSQEDTDKIMDSYNYSLNRINDIVLFLGKSKHFKREENVSIYESIEHVIHGINSTHILKLGVTYENYEDTLKEYSISKKLGNAGFMNIVTVLFNNSIEAGANLITVTIPTKTSEHIFLDFKDNGRGIRDINGNIFKNSGNIISQYGYSTKDEKGNPVVKKGFIYKILKLFNIKLITNDTTRGIGLYMNKVLLESSNGGIKLLSTSDEGTIFRVKIPITKKNSRV